MSSETEPAIRLDGVVRTFGRKRAVDELSLTVARGSVFGFIGLNGAGKTTAIRMMVGLLAPHAGQLRVAGFDIPAQRGPMKLRVGYVPDRCNVYSWMRVSEAIDFCRAFYPAWDENRVGDLLKLFALDPRQRVKHLSKGMAAKLSLLLALAHNPEVLILDEPLSGLDPLVRDEFLECLITDVAKNGQTVLFSSHSLADVQRLADTVGLLHNGKLLFQKPIDELLESTKRVRVVLHESNAARNLPPGVLWQQVEGRQWMLTLENFSTSQLEFLRQNNSIDNLDVTDLSLDDVFKDYMRGRREKEAV